MKQFSINFSYEDQEDYVYFCDMIIDAYPDDAWIHDEKKSSEKATQAVLVFLVIDQEDMLRPMIDEFLSETGGIELVSIEEQEMTKKQMASRIKSIDRDAWEEHWQHELENF